MKLTRYRCDQCGKVASWGPGWASRLYCFGHRLDAWEENVHTCSDECREEWDNETKGMKRKDLLKHIRERQFLNQAKGG